MLFTHPLIHSKGMRTRPFDWGCLDILIIPVVCKFIFAKVMFTSYSHTVDENIFGGDVGLL